MSLSGYAEAIANSQALQPATQRVVLLTHPPELDVLMTLRLAASIRLTLAPHPDIPYVPTSEVREEAREMLTGLGPLMRPADQRTVEAFLWPVADAVEYTPAEDVFFRRVNVACLATQDIPHVAWTMDACMALCRSAGRYMPSVQQIIEAIMPGVQPLLDRHKALTRIANSEETLT